jgi:hypothetical protein
VLVTNPIDRAEKVPSPGESDRGIALDEDVKKQPLALKGPKREQHKRTITVDAAFRPRLGPSAPGLPECSGSDYR